MSKKGFSLIELSIVLVIIGLIIAVVIGSSNLVRISDYKKAVDQIYNLHTAVKTFQTSYDALPGDMSNASSFFSGVTDGDGDGKLGGAEGDNDWIDHLEEAGMVVNYPKDGGGRPIFTFEESWGIEFVWDAQWGKLPSRNVFRLSNYDNNGQILLAPKDVYQIDKKYDDGKPHKGKLITTHDGGCGGVANTTCCVNDKSIAVWTAPYPYDADYNKSLNTKKCMWIFAITEF